MAYHRYHGLDTKIVRIFNTYGPRMRIRDGRAVPAFISQALRNEDVTVFGDGRQTRSFCYISDLVDGIIRLMLSDLNDPVNIGNPAEMTIEEIAQVIIEMTGSKSRIVYKPLPEDDPKVRKPDITRARTLLGWEPKVDLREGLTQHDRVLPHEGLGRADERRRRQLPADETRFGRRWAPDAIADEPGIVVERPTVSISYRRSNESFAVARMSRRC